MDLSTSVKDGVGWIKGAEKKKRKEEKERQSLPEVRGLFEGGKRWLWRLQGLGGHLCRPSGRKIFHSLVKLQGMVRPN